jgi:hypothetical protein
MDKHTNLKGMVSRYKNPTQWTNILSVVFLYLDTIPFKLVCLSIVGGFYIWIQKEWYPDIKNPTMDKHTNLKGMVSRYKNSTQWTNILT